MFLLVQRTCSSLSLLNSNLSPSILLAFRPHLLSAWGLWICVTLLEAIAPWKLMMRNV